MEPTIRSLGKYIYKSSVNPPPTAAEYHESFPALNRGLFVGKMDGTKNDFPYPGIVIRGFPTVLLFKYAPSSLLSPLPFFHSFGLMIDRKSGAGATQSVDVIPYNGERSMNQILKFLDNQDSFRTPNQQQSRGGGDNYERDVDSDEGSRRSDEF